MGRNTHGPSSNVMAASSRASARCHPESDIDNTVQGYLPLPTSSRASTLARKRGEYLSLVELAFARDREGLDQQIWHQIEIDVPRTRPGVQLWMQGCTQRVCHPS